MSYSRCGLTNALYRGTKIPFVRHVNDLFMKCSIPQALLAAVRTFADGVNVEFTVIPRSLICSHFVISLPALNGMSHLRDQLSACWIDDLSPCFWILGAMSFTSSVKNKWLQVSSSSTYDGERSINRYCSLAANCTANALSPGAWPAVHDKCSKPLQILDLS